MLVVLSYYRQSPQWQSHSCSERRVVMIAVVCFISVLYMTSDRKSRLFGSIASRISTGSDSFTITVRTVSDSDPVGGHKSYHFVFARFVPTVTFDSMLHSNFPYTYTTPCPCNGFTQSKKIGSKSLFLVVSVTRYVCYLCLDSL